MKNLYAKKEVIDAAKVQAFRKDFLRIAKILESVSTYTELQQARKYAAQWRKSYELYLKKIREELEQRKRDHRTWEEGVKADPEWVQYYLNKLGDAWPLVSELGSIPRVKDISNFKEVSFDDKVEELTQLWMQDGHSRERAYEQAQSFAYRNPPPTRLEVEQDAVQEWKKEARAWLQRVRRKARDAWKILDELAEWADTIRGGQRPLEVAMPSVETLNLEGFKTVFWGYDVKSDLSELEYLREALRLYKRLVTTRAPILLRKQLPFVVEWSWEQESSHAAAYYTKSAIHITPWALGGGKKNPMHLTKILVHEMGHHIYQTYLSKKATEAWYAFIRGNYKKLDLRFALKEMIQHGDNLEKVDPILALQLEALLHDPNYKYHDLFSAKRIEDYLEQGKDPIVHVPVYPITGYANKNAEESFCEALGMLVTFGPKAVLKPVRDMLRLILPTEIRIARKNHGKN